MPELKPDTGPIDGNGRVGGGGTIEQSATPPSISTKFDDLDLNPRHPTPAETARPTIALASSTPNAPHSPATPLTPLTPNIPDIAMPKIDAHPHHSPQPAMLLEVAWEVCNQVGGIYQVLKSKAPFMVERWGERYCVIGPWNAQTASLEFEETTPTGILGRAVTALREQGLVVHHGRWMISGRPRCLLIEHWQGTDRLDVAKFRLWNDHKISTPAGDGLIDGVITFADAVRRVIEKICDFARDDRAHGGDDGTKVLAHMHEWMGGLAIPMLRHQRTNVGLIFQTHATILGRYMASNEEDFYDRLGWGTIDQAHEATRYLISAQHSIERACTHGCHVMTTVSSITGEECDGLLGRKPDVILPNGLDIQRYNVGHEFQTLHARYKDQINRFVMGHFFPSYSMDLSKTLYFFTSGRYEPRNKGFDVCLEAMARLNAELRAIGSPVNVVFFIITKRPTRALHPYALQQRGVLNEFQSVCDEIMQHLGQKLFTKGATGAKVDLEKEIDEYWVLRYRRTQQAMKVDRLPLVTTHMIEGEDPVMDQIRNVWLFNRHDDPVKVVYHPDFISPTNPLWGMEYDHFVRGCHLGIFPSAYEPWGYTPLESIAMGVPAMTSDLAGFGAYVAQLNKHHERPGMWVVRRRGKSFHDAAAQLARHMLDFCKLDRRGRIALRNQVEAQSWQFDWSALGPAYNEAHDMALERAFGTKKTASAGA
jgi:glycogen(starch) synthase